MPNIAGASFLSYRKRVTSWFYVGLNNVCANFPPRAFISSSRTALCAQMCTTMPWSMVGGGIPGPKATHAPKDTHFPRAVYSHIPRQWQPSSTAILNRWNCIPPNTVPKYLPTMFFINHRVMTPFISPWTEWTPAPPEIAQSNCREPNSYARTQFF